MAKSNKAKKAKRNKEREQQIKTVESIEAKETKDEEVVAEEVENRDDEEEEVDEEEVEETEEESEEETEESDDEDEEEEDDDSDEDESEDDEDDDDEEEDDDEDEEESEDEDSEEVEEDSDEDDEDEEDEDDEDEKKVEKSSKTKVTVVSKKEKKNKKERKAITSEKKEKGTLARIFARKCDANENILTIFGNTKIIAAIIGEIVGTAIVTAIALTLGLFNPLYIILGYVGITLAIYKLSGAHLNPSITAGMMASRRVSAIRGFIYIIAQIIGAWVGTLIIRGFFKAGINSGNIDVTYNALPALTPASEITATTEGFSFFWVFTLIEFLGAIILGFFFARAQAYKKKDFSYAALVGTGVFLTLLFAVVMNNNFFMLDKNTFIFNPAIGLVYGVFPTSAEGFGALMGALMPMLVSYVIFPVLGGILGFFVSDAATVFNGGDFSDEQE